MKNDAGNTQKNQDVLSKEQFEAINLQNEKLLSENQYLKQQLEELKTDNIWQQKRTLCTC